VVIRNWLMFLFLSTPVFLQAADAPVIYSIQTVAGSDSNGDGGPALNALLSQAEGIAVDRLGNIYVADAADNRVRKITPDGNIQTIAGSGVAGFAGDGGPAAQAVLNQPYGLAVDSSGNLYIADLGNARVRKISAGGSIQTVAGGGGTAAGGSVSAAAVNVQLLEPRNVAIDSGGLLYISDFAAHTVYKVSPGGVLSTFAGHSGAIECTRRTRSRRERWRIHRRQRKQSHPQGFERRDQYRLRRCFADGRRDQLDWNFVHCLGWLLRHAACGHRWPDSLYGRGPGSLGQRLCHRGSVRARSDPRRRRVGDRGQRGVALLRRGQRTG